MSDGKPVRIRIEVRGGYGDIYFDGVPVIINAEIPRWGNGAFGLVMGYGATGSYDEIKITQLPDYHLTITTANLLDGTVGLPYVQKLAANGGAIWSVSNLPKGLSSSDDGVISGIPEESGTFKFSVMAENSKENDIKELNIKISDTYISSYKGVGKNFSDGNIELISKSKLPTSPQTFEAWVKIPVSATQRDGVIAGNGAIDGIGGMSTVNFGVTANGNPWLYRKDAKGNVTNYVVPANVKLGGWVHVAIVQDRENNKLICYVNGETADEQVSSIVQETVPIRPLKIGGDYLYKNTRCFPGEIAEIRVWSRALTQNEIRTNMNATLTGNEEGLMANWRLDGDDNDLKVYTEWLPPEFAGGDYSIVVVPDIQNMTLLYPDVLDNMFNWIRDNAEKLNIKFVIQVGDITDKNTFPEWERARDNFFKLDGVVPYAFVLGNHDYAGLPSVRNTAIFNAFFPYEQYSKTSYFGGAFEEGKLDNAYYYFTAGETEYLVLCLEMTPRVSVIEWANKIVSENPDRSVFVTTHSYLSYNGEHSISNGYDTSGCSGKDIWETLVSLHENIVMVFSGHIHYDDIVMRTDAGINGNNVHQFLIDIQDMDYYREGIGVLALLTFSNNGQDIAVNWYSTKEDALFREWNQFSFKINPEELSEPSGNTNIVFAIIVIVLLLLLLILIFVLIRRRSILRKSGK